MIYVSFNEKGIITGVLKTNDIQDIQGCLIFDDIDFPELFGGSNNYIVKNREIVSKVMMPIVLSNNRIKSDGIDSCTITEIPIGATLAINGNSYIVIDGEVNITSSDTKDMPFCLSLFPYLDFEGCIYAN